MNTKTSIATLMTAFSMVLADSSLAEDLPMEKCKILDSNGKGLIKAGMTDCAGGGNSCSGSNGDGDPSAWIYLPSGSCAKIKGGCLAK